MHLYADMAKGVIFMSIWNSLFGGMFDFNGDGEVDSAETALGFALLDEISGDDEEDSEEDFEDFSDDDF